jgi:hypothetical protein
LKKANLYSSDRVLCSIRQAANSEVLSSESFDCFGMKTQGHALLKFERKPTASGFPVQHPVGGEILPVNSLQLLLANFWWIFLLAIPVLMYWLAAKYGVRTPPPFRQALRLVPVIVRMVG